MSKGKDPAFLFYSGDFLTGVSDLTMEERGQYITLLCLQHQKGRLSGKAVALAVASATEDVLAKFDKDEDGNIFNERLEAEIQKRAEHSRKQSDRARSGWKKRKEKKDVGIGSGNAAASAAALPLENEIENENEDINRIDNKEGDCQEGELKFGKPIQTHQDLILEKLLNSFEWIEQIQRHFSITDQEEIKEALRMFVSEQMLKNELDRPDREIRNHFFSWFKIGLEKKRRQNKFQVDPNQGIPKDESVYDELSQNDATNGYTG